MFSPLKPYNDLPPLPPSVELETKPVLKHCVAARAALAELRLAGQLIPDPTVLINSIPMLEAKDSSAIENIVTTNDALFREASLNIGEADPATKEALRYRSALFRGFQSLAERPLSTRTIIAICHDIKGIALDIRATPGTTLRNTATGEVIYTPPEGQAELRAMLANWERFLNEPTDLDPLVRMAVLHYQFEAIHPFIDGNGRTGRILNILCLVQDKLLELPTLYLSRQILRTRDEYYRLLMRVTSHQDWEAWIVYVVAAVAATAGWTNAKVRAIRDLMDMTAEHMRRRASKIYTRELVDLLFAQPYCRIGDVVGRGLAKRQSASVYLKTLAEIGILEEQKAGREKLFLNRKYLDLLNSDGHQVVPYPGAPEAKADARRLPISSS